MKILLLCLMIVCLSWGRENASHNIPENLTCDCGWRNRGRIFGGKATTKNEYPWMAWLNIGCGASIITKRHILTAAHCTYRLEASILEVSVGKHYRSDESANEQLKLHLVERIIQHEDYVWAENGAPHDISILVLATPITFNHYVGPVCLPKRRFVLVGKYIILTGWGRIEGNGEPKALRQVNLKVVHNKICRWSWPNFDTKRTQLCTLTHRKDSCNGDSGSPLVYLDPETNRYTQVAFVSYGNPDCGEFPMPSVNTDVYSYMRWIRNATRQDPKAQFCTKIIK